MVAISMSTLCIIFVICLQIPNGKMEKCTAAVLRFWHELKSAWTTSSSLSAMYLDLFSISIWEPLKTYLEANWRVLLKCDSWSKFVNAHIFEGWSFCMPYRTRCTSYIKSVPCPQSFDYHHYELRMQWLKQIVKHEICLDMLKVWHVLPDSM